MEIDGVGPLTKSDYDWYESAPVPVAVLGGRPCRFIFEGIDTDPNPSDFQTAITNFLSLGEATLAEAAPHVFRYYRDMSQYWDDDPEFPVIETAKEVWKHVQFGDDAQVTRRLNDTRIYISLECNCDWEPEHGLQIVLKEGKRINKVGPFNGHLTNSDAYADKSLEEVIYRATGE